MKRNIIFTCHVLIIFSFLLIFSGCEEEKEGIIVSIEHPDTGQLFEIVNAYKLYQDYFDEISQKKQDKNINELYQNMIIDSVYNQCFEGGEHLHMVNSLLNNAPKDEAAISKLIGNIDPNRLNEVIKDALIRSSSLLPTESKTTVCVFPALENEERSAVNVGSGKITAFYHENYTNDAIKSTIAHEYHHSVWTEKYSDTNNATTVLENIIFEGKAVTFEKLLYPEGSIVPIYPYYSMKDWEMVEADFNRISLERSLEIMIGGGDLPPLYGYSVGGKMVQSYLDKYPELTPIEWLGISADVIYEESEFPTPF